MPLSQQSKARFFTGYFLLSFLQFLEGIKTAIFQPQNTRLNSETRLF